MLHLSSPYLQSIQFSLFHGNPGREFNLKWLRRCKAACYDCGSQLFASSNQLSEKPCCFIAHFIVQTLDLSQAIQFCYLNASEYMDLHGEASQIESGYSFIQH